MLIHAMLRDARYGIRGLVKRPRFASIVVLILALGIGANAAVFAALEALILHALPYDDPNRLVALFETSPRFEVLGGRYPARARSVARWRQDSRTMEIAALQLSEIDVAGLGEPERVTVARASVNVFPLLGVQPAQGRWLRDDEEHAGRDDVILISDRFWRRHFSRDAQVLGASLTLDGRSHTVVGVMPVGFDLPPQSVAESSVTAIQGRVEIWKPLALTSAELMMTSDYNYDTLARLRPGTSIERAQKEMTEITAGLRQQYPRAYRDLGVAIAPLNDEAVAGLQPAMLMLLSAAGFVLLIACANVASLMLERAAGRQKEVAIRLALGARRLNIVAQMLSESLALALVGGGLGVALSSYLVPVFERLAPSLPRLEHATVDVRVLVFSLGVSLITSMLVGVGPALVLVRRASHTSLRVATESRRVRAHSALVVLQIALSVVLLIGASLLLRSLVRAANVAPGFASENVLTARLALSRYRFRTPEAGLTFFHQVEETVAALPGVTAVGLIDRLPLTARVSGLSSTVYEGQAPPALEGSQTLAQYRTVSTGYFRAMGIALIRGRAFTRQDRADQPGVAVVNATMAQAFWGSDAIGKRFKRGIYADQSPWIEVVGVVSDVRQSNLEDAPNLQVYLPADQAFLARAALVVRTANDPMSSATAVRHAIQQVDPLIPIQDVRTMTQVMGGTLGKRRFDTTLLVLFGVLALVLTVVGVYAVVCHSIARRRIELGIRAALGARPQDAVWLVANEGFRLVAVGLAIGFAIAVAFSRLLRSQLFGVDPLDAVSLLAGCFVVAMTAALAIYIPARRTARLNPLDALRYE